MIYRICLLARNLAKDVCGTTAPLFGLLTLPLMAIAGLAIDQSNMLHTRAALQAVADATAIAGARLPATANENRLRAASAMFEGTVSGTQFEAIVPSIAADNSEVAVTLAYSQPTLVLGLFGIEELSTSVTSAARSQIENGGVACVLALNPEIDDGLRLQGINKSSSQNCWTWVNSDSPSSINAVGAAVGTAQGFCTVGGVEGGSHFSPAPFAGCEPLADPFADRFAASYPASATCDFTNVSRRNGNFVLSPGVYCGNTVLKPHADVTFLPGVYVFKNGYLEVQGGASAHGSGVAFFFSGENTRLVVRGGGNVDLKAPTTGDYAGFVLVDRSDAGSSSIRETVIQGGGRIKLEGILYAPEWRVNISGNGEMNAESQYFAMIADHFYMEGNGRLFIKSDFNLAGLPDLMPKIKSGPVLTQ